jgi:hypothetical protein
METNNIFSVHRLYLLIRRQVFSNGKSLLIAFGGVSGFLLIISLLVAYFNPTALSGLTVLYFTTMFIGGFIFTSNFFGEMHQIQKSYSFLTLPVSINERLAAGWILTGILFPLFSLLVMAAIVFSANLVMNFTVDMAPFQSVFSNTSMKLIKIYIITQSIFLFGSVYFRKNNFLKTLLALIVVSLILNIYTGLLGWALFGTFNSDMMVIDGNNLTPAMNQLFTNHIPYISKFVFNYLVLPFFMVTTWFGLKERQV